MAESKQPAHLHAEEKEEGHKTYRTPISRIIVILPAVPYVIAIAIRHPQKYDMT